MIQTFSYSAQYMQVYYRQTLSKLYTFAFYSEYVVSDCRICVFDTDWRPTSAFATNGAPGYFMIYILVGASQSGCVKWGELRFGGRGFPIQTSNPPIKLIGYFGGGHVELRRMQYVSQILAGNVAMMLMKKEHKEEDEFSTQQQQTKAWQKANMRSG